MRTDLPAGTYFRFMRQMVWQYGQVQPGGMTYRLMEGEQIPDDTEVHQCVWKPQRYLASKKVIRHNEFKPIRIVNCQLSNLFGKNEWCGRAARFTCTLDNGNDIRICPAHLREMREERRVVLQSIKPITEEIREAILAKINEDAIADAIAERSRRRPL